MSYKTLGKRISASLSRELIFLLLREGIKTRIKSQNILVQFSIGALIGVIETLLTYPNSYCKGLTKIGFSHPSIDSGLVESGEKIYRKIFVEEGVAGLYEGSKLFFVTSMLFNGLFNIGYSYLQQKYALSKLNFFPRIVGSILVLLGCNFSLAVLNKWKYKVRDKSIADKIKFLMTDLGLRKKKSKIDMAYDELKKIILSLKTMEVHEQWIKDFWSKSFATSLTLFLFESILTKFS